MSHSCDTPQTFSRSVQEWPEELLQFFLTQVREVGQLLQLWVGVATVEPCQPGIQCLEKRLSGCVVHGHYSHVLAHFIQIPDSSLNVVYGSSLIHPLTVLSIA